jgi:hypothetical protein
MKKITQILYMATAFLFAGSMVVSAQPTTSAPTPPARSTAKVISILAMLTQMCQVQIFHHGGDNLLSFRQSRLEPTMC